MQINSKNINLDLNSLELNKEKMSQWQKNGAQITTGVDKLINPDKYPKKIKNIKEGKSCNIKFLF